MMKRLLDKEKWANLPMRPGFGSFMHPTDEKLTLIKQLGVDDILLNMYRTNLIDTDFDHLPLPGDHQWEYKDLLMLRNRVENAEIRLLALENMPFSFYDTEEDWDRVMNINLKGYFLCIKASLPYMIAAEKGSVINLSSTQAHRSWDDWTAYAAAKGAIISMTRQLAGQFGKNNIRFNSLSPGTILTPMAKNRIVNEGEAFLKASEKQAALLRCGEPEEVAMAAVFLASDESRFITGDDIKIDGGLSILPRYFDY